MELVLYFILSWLVISLTITCLRREDAVRSLIIYFIYTMMTVSCFTIFSLDMHLLRQSLDKTRFLSLLLSRNIVMPLAAVIFANAFYRLSSWKKLLPVAAWMAAAACMELVNLRLQLYYYVQWSYSLSFMVNCLFILIILLVGRYISRIQFGGSSG